MTKYHARKVTEDGITFDSLAEARRYEELKLHLASGLISDLQVHWPFDIVVNDNRICKYIADFVYYENGERVVEDVKGVRTAVYKLKKKLMSVVNGIEIVEIER